MQTVNPYEAPAADLAAAKSDPSAGNAFTPVMVEALRATKPWVRFLSVLGFVGSGFMLLAGIVVIVAGAFVSEFGGGMGAAIGAVYLVLGAMYIVPLIHLHRYANAIGHVTGGGGARAVEEALVTQKTFWRSTGIIMAAFLILYFVGIFVAVIVGVVSAVSR